VGVNASEEIIDELREQIKDGRLKEKEQVTEALRGILEGMIGEGEPLKLETAPSVILVIGVNGVGKTTAIAKLANLYKAQGKKVMLAAGDTFRAAATEQLCTWAARVDVPVVKAGEGADPAAVIFDAVTSAAARGADIVICDTAGRLHNKKHLMDELSKVRRVVSKASANASVESLLVLDAVTGQNAIHQAAEFIEAAGATGIILTKLDGTAKGGSVISIKTKLGLPVRYVGVGEGVDDLMVFSARDFAEALFKKDED
jgi:fused signal recognition particle receptor